MCGTLQSPPETRPRSVCQRRRRDQCSIGRAARPLQKPLLVWMVDTEEHAEGRRPLLPPPVAGAPRWRQRHPSKLRSCEPFSLSALRFPLFYFFLLYCQTVRRLWTGASGQDAVEPRLTEHKSGRRPSETESAFRRDWRPRRRIPRRGVLRGRGTSLGVMRRGRQPIVGAPSGAATHLPTPRHRGSGR